MSILEIQTMYQRGCFNFWIPCAIQHKIGDFMPEMRPKQPMMPLLTLIANPEVAHSGGRCLHRICRRNPRPRVLQ